MTRSTLLAHIHAPIDAFRDPELCAKFHNALLKHDELEESSQLKWGSACGMP